MPLVRENLEKLLRRSPTFEKQLGVEARARLSELKTIIPLTMSEEAKENLDSKISYKKAADYWSGVDPTIDGMLGGFGKISQIDIEGSSKFLKALFKVEKLVLDEPRNSYRFYGL